jgi:hypothetical protein
VHGASAYPYLRAGDRVHLEAGLARRIDATMLPASPDRPPAYAAEATRMSSGTSVLDEITEPGRPQVQEVADGVFAYIQPDGTW